VADVAQGGQKVSVSGGGGQTVSVSGGGGIAVCSTYCEVNLLSIEDN